MAWVTKLTTIRTQLKKLLRLLTQNCFFLNGDLQV